MRLQTCRRLRKTQWPALSASRFRTIATSISPPNKRTQDVLNIQPVIPIGVAKNWNLIIRWITPTIWQPDPSVKDIGFYGFGDMQPTFFLSPKKTGKVIWG